MIFVERLFQALASADSISPPYMGLNPVFKARGTNMEVMMASRVCVKLF
jgi:hypothetical protein